MSLLTSSSPHPHSSSPHPHLIVTYDHVQVLGDTLTLIAGEKAGIFKKGVPAITMDQEDEAMDALKAHVSSRALRRCLYGPDLGHLQMHAGA